MCTVDALALAPQAPSTYPSGVAPELHVLGEAILGEAIREAEDTLCRIAWGPLFCKAVLYRAAHLLAVRYPRVATGTSASGAGSGVPAGVKSSKTGDESRTYAHGAALGVGLQSTRYGQMFIALRRENVSRGPRFYGASR